MNAGYSIEPVKISDTELAGKCMDNFVQFHNKNLENGPEAAMKTLGPKHFQIYLDF